MPTHSLLGRAAGLTNEQLERLADDPLPPGVFTPSQETVIRYARAAARHEPVTDELYAELTRHFNTQQIMEICFTTGLSMSINRFHLTFLTDVDETTPERLAAVSCRVRVPTPPTPSGGDQRAS